MEANKISKQVQFPRQDNVECDDHKNQNDLNVNDISSKHITEQG